MYYGTINYELIFYFSHANMETGGSSETSYLRYRTVQSPNTEDLKNTIIDRVIFLNKELPLIPKFIATLGAILVLFTAAALSVSCK